MQSELSRKNSETLFNRYPEYNKLVAQYVSEYCEPKIIRSHGIFYKLFKKIVSTIEYGYVYGYFNAFRKVITIFFNRFIAKKTYANKPRIQVWSHEITKSGAPIVLIDIIKQWRKDDDYPKNIDFNFPFGARVDRELLSKLDDDNIHFNEVRMSAVSLNYGDVVILNSTAQPNWLYEKIITQLKSDSIKHL